MYDSEAASLRDSMRRRASIHMSNFNVHSSGPGSIRRPGASGRRPSGHGVGWGGVALLLLAIFGQGDPAFGDAAGPSARPIRVRSWRVEDGLPAIQIQFLTQAGDGFLWLGARHEGLFRF